MERIMEKERALEKSSFMLSQSEKYLASSISSDRMMRSLSSSKMANKAWSFGQLPSLINGTIVNDHFLRSLYNSSLYTHIDLFKGYEEEDIQQPEETKETKSPIILLDDIIKVQTLIKNIYVDNSEIYRIEPYDFERMVAELLRDKGLKVELTKQTRDGGKDIIAIHDLGALGVSKYLVECKRWRADRGVDVNVIRSFCYTLAKEKANKGMIFTSSYFTRDAYELKASEKSLLEFRDGAAILDWLAEYLKLK